jgi:decaprenylphospho-beta-D-erythro-pentofuranosid-2-ulose 2-reductase
MLNGTGQLQNVVLFGGNSDIGLAILKKLPMAPDSTLILVGRNLNYNEVASKFPESNVEIIEFDFENIDKIDILFSIISKQRDIDVAILAYGYLGEVGTDTLLREINQQILNNYYSPAMLFSKLFERFRNQKHGKILVITSVAGIRPRISNFVYGSAKSGLDFLVRGSQNESKKNNFTVSVLRPGFVESKMTHGLKPPAFSVKPDRVAEDAVKGLLRQKKIIYSPAILKYIFTLLRFSPDFIFNKLK